jgi:hypothetical protein
MLSCHLPGRDIAIILLCPALFVLSLWKYLYNSNCIKSRGKFALINDGIFQFVHKLDRSAIMHTFQASNDYVLDHLPLESTHIAIDADYDFWDTTLGHPFKANVNCKLCEN